MEDGDALNFTKKGTDLFFTTKVAYGIVSNHRVQGSGAPVALILGGPPGRLRGSCRLLHLLCPAAGKPASTGTPDLL